jgi:hypothetical protein
MMSAQAKWRKLDGANSMPETVQGVATQRRDQTTHPSRLITPSPTLGPSSGRWSR